MSDHNEEQKIKNLIRNLDRDPQYRRAFLLKLAAVLGVSFLELKGGGLSDILSLVHGPEAEAQLLGNGFLKRNRFDLKKVIQLAGLSANLSLCLDVGSLSSYSGTGQIWSDLSGNGNHFQRGNSAGNSTYDPVFVGDAGSLNEETYWNISGGGFSAAQTIAFDDGWPKNGAKFTIGILAYGAFKVANCSSFVEGPAGVAFYSSSGNKTVLGSFNSTGWYVQSLATISNINSYNWYLNSLDETAGNWTVGINSSVVLANLGGWDKPSAGNAVAELTLGASGSFDSVGSASSRIVAVAIWNGKAVNDTEGANLYTKIKKFRFNSLS